MVVHPDQQSDREYSKMYAARLLVGLKMGLMTQFDW
jgi:hypothetical protein